MIFRRAVLGAIAAAVLGVPAQAEDTLEIRLTIRDHRFEPARIEVPAGKPFKLIVTNADPTPEEFESVGLRVERVIQGGKATTFSFRPLRLDRSYKFFGEFHKETAQGEIIPK